MPLERALGMVTTAGRMLLYPGTYVLPRPLMLGARAVQIFGRGAATVTCAHRDGVLSSSSVAGHLEGITFKGGANAPVLTVNSGSLSLIDCDIEAGRDAKARRACTLPLLRGVEGRDRVAPG